MLLEALIPGSVNRRKPRDSLEDIQAMNTTAKLWKWKTKTKGKKNIDETQKHAEWKKWDSKGCIPCDSTSMKLKNREN